jgi:ABC-2 type transport system permease protein
VTRTEGAGVTRSHRVAASGPILLPLLRKTFRDHLRGILGWIGGILALIAVQLSVYPTVRDTTSRVTDFTDAFPEAFKKIFRMDEYGTAVGYLSTELFSATLPLIFIAVGVTWGARVATDEVEAGTADILFSLPISRRRFLLTRIAAKVCVLHLLAVVLALALLVGTPIVDMSVAVERLIAASWSTAVTGMVFGSVGVLVGALSGRRSMALGIALTVSIASFVVYSLAPLVDVMDDINHFNPMQWTVGAESLRRGFDAGYTLAALVFAALLMSGEVMAFDRRDML